MQHSKLNSEELDASLHAEESENDLMLVFENNISQIEPLNEKLDKVKTNWNTLDTNISQEGGSGFSKIKKILQSDLNRKKCNFEYDIIDNRLKIYLRFEKNDIIYESTNN